MAAAATAMALASLADHGLPRPKKNTCPTKGVWNGLISYPKQPTPKTDLQSNGRQVLPLKKRKQTLAKKKAK